MDMHNMTISKKYILQDLRNALLESEKSVISTAHCTSLASAVTVVITRHRSRCTHKNALEQASTVLVICMHIPMHACYTENSI